MRVTLVSCFVVIGAAVAASAGAQQNSRCADCHFAQTNPPSPDHLFDWDRSPHARNNIGCERCHGGNSAVFEPFLAHRGVLRSTDKKSPVNRANLPATCGSCHVGPFVAFQASRHYALLKAGNKRGPTCSSCHDAVAGVLLSPKALESECNECHGPAEIAPRDQRAKEARDAYEALHAVRSELKIANQLIKKIGDRQRRVDLMDMAEQAAVPVTRAVDAGHQFVYDDLRNNLSIAQQRIDKLMNAIVNRVD
jgi:nitrate/TMAO reductase-like tetraheme cytochrome c subunit